MDYNLGRFFHLSKEMYCILTTGGLIKKINQAFSLQSGWMEEELVKKPLIQFIHPDNRSEVEEVFNKMLPGISGAFNCLFQHKSGNYKKFYWTVHLENKLMYSIIQEIVNEDANEKIITDQIEELTEVRSKLKELAISDPLTKLKNRRAYFEQFEVLYRIACRQKKALSVIILNIDDFKTYNDAFGPEAGDMVLKHIARLLLQSCRESDIAARYSGEEFVLLLPETDKIGAIFLCERIQSTVEGFQWRHRKVTASYGITSVMAVEKSFSADIIRRIMSEADRALRNSKKLGKNRYTHSDDLEVSEEILNNSY